MAKEHYSTDYCKPREAGKERDVDICESTDKVHKIQGRPVDDEPRAPPSSQILPNSQLRNQK